MIEANQHRRHVKVDLTLRIGKNICTMWSRVVYAVLVNVLLVTVVRQGYASRPKAFQCWSTPANEYQFVTKPCFTSPAGRVLCRCSNTTQDCSSNYGALTYIPMIFSGVQIMNFSNNGLRRLEDEWFFFNVSRDVWQVDLYNNGMNNISNRAFHCLHKLRSVLIGGNKLSYDALKPVWRIPNLNDLDIKCGGLGLIPTGFFNQTRALNLRYLDLSWNNIETLDMRELQPLRSLSRLSLWHNHLATWKTAYMPSLTYLSFHKNRLYQFPVTCKEGSITESLFPNLRELNLNFNVITAITRHVCLPALKLLNLSYNRIVYFTENLFSAIRFPALENLLMTEMESEIRQIKSYTFNNSGISYIGLGFNWIDFSSRAGVVDPEFLAGCTGLKHLDLQKNKFSQVSTEQFHRFFQPLAHLETLHLNQNNLGSIATDTFINLPELESLYLYGNALTSLPNGAFDNLPSLCYLDLNSNQISTVSRRIFNASTRNRLRKLDLCGNPFHCDCDILWFQQWMQSSPDVFKDFRHHEYTCVNEHNTTLSTFDINPQACLLDQLSSVTIITCFSIIAFLLSASILIFAYRWRLQLWIYSICRGHHKKSNRQSHAPPGGFQYDVFLTYAEEDMEWVQNELLPVLEEEWGLAVCLHQRDFVPGKHIIDNISDCVSNSDRFLMVFSPHFARSQWCQFELKYCQICVMDRDDVMVMVALQETSVRQMTGAMLAVMRTTTYIEWDDSQAARDSFWGRLKLALHDVSK